MKNHPTIEGCFSFALTIALLLSSAQAQTLSATRVSGFEYHASGAVAGMLSAEEVETGDANNCVRTVHGYDTFGNKSSAATSNCASASGSAVFASRTTTSAYSTYTITLKNTAGTDISVAVPAGTYARTVTNALNQSETRTVDPRFGVMTQLTGPNALATTWRYDDFGRKTRETRADGTYTDLAYCTLTGLGLDTSANTPSVTGQASAVNNLAGCDSLPAITPPGEAVAFVHSQPKDKLGAVMGAFTRVYSDRLGREIRSITQAFDRNPDGSAAASVRLIVKDTIYNEFGAKIAETQPYYADTGSSLSTATAGAAPMGRTFTEYDVLGRPVNMYMSDPAAANTVAMPAISNSALNGRFTDGGGTAARTSSSYNGINLTTTNARGQTYTQEKDPLGQVVRVTDALGAQVAYKFDPFGNLIQTRDGVGNQTSAQFDKRGRRTQLNDPNTGTWGYCYNALGELKAQQNPNQRGSNTPGACPATDGSTTATAVAGWTTMAYDVLGRMTSRAHAEYVTTWTYDKYADNTACTKGIGKLCQVVTSHGVNRKLTFDSLGRLLNTQLTLGGAANGNITRSYTTSQTYDANKGWVKDQTWPTGVKVAYLYSALGYQYQMNNAAGNAMLWRAQRMSAWGKLEEHLVGNAVQTRTGYQGATGRVGSISAGVGVATNVFNHAYQWDAVGNLTQRNDANGDGASSGAVTETFFYDSINRLEEYRVANGSIPGTQRVVGVSYNAAGNILYKSDVGAYAYGANGAARPHGLASLSPIGGGSIGYAYDLNGNLTGTTSSATTPGQAAKYSQIRYTSFNLPDGNTTGGGLLGSQSPTPTRYSWQYDDSQARIIEKRVSPAGTRTTYSLHPDKAGGLSFEQEFAETGSISNRHYLSAGGMVIGVLFTAGEHTATATAAVLTNTEYWHKDHLGSSGAITNASGAITNRYAYDPWGKRRFTNGNYDANGTLVGDTPGGSDRGFTGHEHLDDVGIIHMNGRLYDPHSGRFIQPDPHIQAPEHLQSFNRYSYVLNNPLNATDPTGEIWGWIAAAVFSAIVAKEVPELRPFLAIAWSIALAPGAGFVNMGIGPIAQTAVAGFTSGAIGSGSVKGGMRGMATAMLFYGVGRLADSQFVGAAQAAEKAADPVAALGNAQAVWGNGGLARIGLHALAGCASAATSGGDCGKGAATAGFTKAAGAYSPSFDGVAANTVKYAIIGGTVEVIGGGKFANGATTGAFQYLFNQAMTEAQAQAAANARNRAVMSGRCVAGFEHVCAGTQRGYNAAEAAAQKEKALNVTGTVADKTSTGLALAIPFVGPAAPEVAIASALLKGYAYWAIPPTTKEIIFDTVTTVVGPTITYGREPAFEFAVTLTTEALKPVILNPSSGPSPQPAACPAIPRKC